MRLKEIRIEKDISVAKLSEMTGIHRRTIQDIEKRGDCLISNAKAFAKVLGVSLDELCEEEPEE